MEEEKFSRVFADRNQIENGRENISELEGPIEKLASVFNLAGNNARLKILYLLQDKHELCVCDLSDILKMKIPAISQHLRKMKDGGIIDNEKVSQTVYYHLVPEYEDLIKSFFDLLNVKEETERAS
ncbi:MAG: winged helix-turn-helix transcriptional regulator [Flavobacteriales bacterium]|nr:winged helix-turn-helix transcriptional regulator [Flavobacteriales bacterium]PCH89748.1 MAG: transcriptional regulator [Flavobacteriales bacterium]